MADSNRTQHLSEAEAAKRGDVFFCLDKGADMEARGNGLTPPGAACGRYDRDSLPHARTAQPLPFKNSM